MAFPRTGGGGGGGSVDSVVPGALIAVDDTDPANPVVGVGSTDDGTNTYAITAVGSSLQSLNTVDASGELAFTSLVATTNQGQVTAHAEDSDGHEAELNLSAQAPHGFIYFETDNNEVNLYVVTDDPNATLTGNVGDLAIDTGTPGLWQNTDGATAWSKFTALP